jgi:multicomponent Na+:H+ antiporter subunit A
VGGEVLQSVIVDIHIPVVGTVHLVTSLFFDMGVFLVVVGLVLDVLRSLGAEIDRQGELPGAGSAGSEHGVGDNALGPLTAAAAAAKAGDGPVPTGSGATSSAVRSTEEASR